MTTGKIKELRDKILHHRVKDDRAVVELSARDLQELLDFAERSLFHGVCDVGGCCREPDEYTDHTSSL